MVTSLVCASDNRAETALKAFPFWSKSIWITSKSSRWLWDYIYQPRIQASLDEFKEGWNHHPVSTEKNSTLYQIWLMGMMDSKYESRRGVRSYLELNSMNVNEFGIDPDMLVKSTYKHKANLTIKLMKYWNSWKSFSLNWWMMGIMELTVFVKFEMSFWKLYYEHANIMQMVCFQLPKPMFSDVLVKWKNLWSIAY